jgi:hypothetical protein
LTIIEYRRGTILATAAKAPEGDQEKWVPVFLQNRATNKELRTTTEWRCFHRK